MPIPPSMMQRQALQAQSAMMPRPNPQDALLQALSAQALQGEMQKETANFKIKMLKLRQKYQGGTPPQGPQPQGGL